MIRLVKLGPGKDSTSDNLSVYKHGQADGSSVKTNYLVRSSSVQTNLLAYSISSRRMIRLCVSMLYKTNYYYTCLYLYSAEFLK